MKRRRHTPEQIIRKLREADRLLAEGRTTVEVARQLEVSENTYHRWRNQFGGMKANDAKRLKELEQRYAVRAGNRRRGSIPRADPPVGHAASICASATRVASKGREAGLCHATAPICAGFAKSQHRRARTRGRSPSTARSAVTVGTCVDRANPGARTRSRVEHARRR